MEEICVLEKATKILLLSSQNQVRPMGPNVKLWDSDFQCLRSLLIDNVFESAYDVYKRDMYSIRSYWPCVGSKLKCSWRRGIVSSCDIQTHELVHDKIVKDQHIFLMVVCVCVREREREILVSSLDVKYDLWDQKYYISCNTCESEWWFLMSKNFTNECCNWECTFWFWEKFVRGLGLVRKTYLECNQS